MTECATDIDKVIKYYGSLDGNELGAHFSFNFYLIGLYDDTRPARIKQIVDEWQSKLPNIYTLNWLVSHKLKHLSTDCCLGNF